MLEQVLTYAKKVDIQLSTFILLKWMSDAKQKVRSEASGRELSKFDYLTRSFAPTFGFAQSFFGIIFLYKII